MSDFNNIATFRLADADKINNLPADTNSELAGKADASHTHDDRYYTEIETNSLLSGKQSISEKGQPSGYASLDGTGKVPASQLPATVVGGDMSRSTYDVNDNGIVDNSEKLGGELPSHYLDVDNHTDGTTNKVYTTTEKTKLAGIEAGAEVNNISDVNATDLTDGGDSTLHYHASDRNRANHTGTQAVSTITANGNALAWNTDESTLDIPLNANVTLQTGQETLWLGRNTTGSVIPNGTVVYATGTIGASGRITIAPYIADGSISGIYTLGITTEAIAVGADGFITHFGKVRGLNTSSFTEGTVLYASPTTAGALTSTAPSYPNVRIPIAFVITSHASVGTLAVRVPSLDTEMVHKTGNETIAGDKTFSGRVETSEATAVASASTVDLNTINGNFVHITGTTTINSFGATARGSYELCFDSAGLTITNGAIRLPTGANIVTQAGDTMIVRGETTTGDWRVISYQRKDGSALYSAGGGGGLTAYEGYIAGELTTGTIFETSLAGAKTFTKFKCNVKTLPTGADLIIKTYKNGVEDASVTIATTASATNGLYVADDTTFVSGVFAENDRLTISITQVGSTLSGTNLTWQLI